MTTTTPTWWFIEFRWQVRSPSQMPLPNTHRHRVGPRSWGNHPPQSVMRRPASRVSAAGLGHLFTMSRNL